MGYPAGKPREGFVVEIDGRFVSEYGSITAALNAGLEAKQKQGAREVRVYDAQERVQPAEPFAWWMALADPAGCV